MAATLLQGDNAADVIDVGFVTEAWEQYTSSLTSGSLRGCCVRANVVSSLPTTITMRDSPDDLTTDGTLYSAIGPTGVNDTIIAQMGYLENGLGGARYVYITHNAGGTRQVNLRLFEGGGDLIGATGTLENSVSDATGTGSPATASVSNTTASSLVLGFYINTASRTLTYAGDGTELPFANNIERGAYRITTAATSTANTWTWTGGAGSGDWAVVMGVFAGTGGGGPTTYYETPAVTAVATPGMTMKVTYGRLFEVQASGVVSEAHGLALGSTHDVVATGVADMSSTTVLGITGNVIATGQVLMQRLIGKSFGVVTSATVEASKTISKTLAATATGVVESTQGLLNTVTSSVTASAIVSSVQNFIAGSGLVIKDFISSLFRRRRR